MGLLDLPTLTFKKKKDIVSILSQNMENLFAFVRKRVSSYAAFIISVSHKVVDVVVLAQNSNLLYNVNLFLISA